MGVYLYIHNKYTQYTHICYVNKHKKHFILDAINHLTALYIYTVYIYIYMPLYNKIIIYLNMNKIIYN